VLQEAKIPNVVIVARVMVTAIADSEKLLYEKSSIFFG